MAAGQESDESNKEVYRHIYRARNSQKVEMP